ncbi:MAG: hypothetical protein OIF57_06340 [Marinobacterium sp.]|nr:hypothetical protein [Marinobacterium sp.]
MDEPLVAERLALLSGVRQLIKDVVYRKACCHDDGTSLCNDVWLPG